MSEDARRTAELAARASYGRLVALLAGRTRDIAAAEDGLADAFEAALRHWPERGVPANPEAWLLTAARNRVVNQLRDARLRESREPELQRRIEELSAGDGDAFPDARLRLLFVCAHPAIDPSVRTPLMLQTVLGLDAARIAAAFLVSSAAMGQRLVRAKAKIRDAAVPFTVPEAERLAERLPDVLDAVYAAYGTGWDALGGAPEVSGLTAEALFLAELLVQLLPREPEALGLHALLLHCEARRAARRGAGGAFVPLAEQDTRLWSRDMIARAENALIAAARQARFGRYQCEAAIQSVHAQRAMTGRTNWEALLTLHDLLAARTPSFGSLVSRAAVLLEARGAEPALAALDALSDDRLQGYQPYWVVRARVLKALGRGEAADARSRALGLTHDPALRDHLLSSL